MGENGTNEVVTLNVTKPSKFKKGIDVVRNILNNGTLTQNGISTFNNEVKFVEYTKNPNTETAEIIIPILNINTLKPGNKIVFYNKGYDVNSNPYICGIGIKQDSSSITAAYMDYYCNSLGVKSGHRFYAASSKVLDINSLSMTHVGKTAVLCGDNSLYSGFQFENNKLNEISLLFKSDISDSVSDSSIVVSNTMNFFTPNSGKMVITSAEIELTSNRLSQYFNGTASTTYVNSNQSINISKITSLYSNISDVTTIISGSNSFYEDQGTHQTKCKLKVHTGTYHTTCSNSTTGITDYNDTFNRIVSTNYKSYPFTLNSSDASIVVQNNNSSKENGGICSINAGILNLASNTPDVFSASTINIGSTLSTTYIRGRVIFDNADLSATNLPDYIRQIVRSRI